jgi:GLPGLI family protein
MKKSVLTILMVTLMLVAFSQTGTVQVRNQGAITYEEVVKFDIQLDDISPEMQEMMPKENRTETILYFNDEASRYENLVQSTDATMEEESEGGGIRIMISQPENVVYRDLKDKKIINQQEFMTRVFLIESDFQSNEWKLSGNQKMILDYPCQEATKMDGEDTIRVWFTPVIPVSTGPADFGNLPGLVLAVDINNSDRNITAKSIDLEEIDLSKLQKPTKGKKVSDEEFKSIVEEKTKEMGSESCGGKTIIMKIQR